MEHVSPQRASQLDDPVALLAEAEHTAEQWVSFLEGAPRVGQSSVLAHCDRLRQRLAEFEAINAELTSKNASLARMVAEKNGQIDDLAARAAVTDAAQADRNRMAAELETVRAGAAAAKLDLAADK